MQNPCPRALEKVGNASCWRRLILFLFYIGPIMHECRHCFKLVITTRLCHSIGLGKVGNRASALFKRNGTSASCVVTQYKRWPLHFFKYFIFLLYAICVWLLCIYISRMEHCRVGKTVRRGACWNRILAYDGSGCRFRGATDGASSRRCRNHQSECQSKHRCGHQRIIREACTYATGYIRL